MTWTRTRNWVPLNSSHLAAWKMSGYDGCLYTEVLESGRPRSRLSRNAMDVSSCRRVARIYRQTALDLRPPSEAKKKV